MKLTDLEPRWIHPNVFVFLCPHCREWLLVCKNIQMTHKQQRTLLEKEFGEDWNNFVVMARDDCAWSISGTRPLDPKAAFVEDLSVTPSIDASASGHWHGFITKGEIVGGL
jgi:hypothetical protein